MLPFKTFVSFASRNPIISMAQLAFLMLPLVSLVGCSDGTEGPMTASLSTVTEATAGFESNHTANSSAADSNGEEDPKIDMISTPTGVTAHVAWDAPDELSVTGYNIYYGKRSSEKSNSEISEESNSEVSEPIACSGESQIVKAPRATITELEPDTEYFFAIRAFNDTESICSNEITVVTPPIQS